MITSSSNSYDLLASIGLRLGLASAMVLASADLACAQSSPLADLMALQPSQASDLALFDRRRFDDARRLLDDWASDQTWNSAADVPAQIARVRSLIEAKKTVDRALQSAWSLRTTVAGHEQSTVTAYLYWTSGLIDASGRLRYVLRDAIEEATYAASDSPKAVDLLLRTLISSRLSVCAEELNYVLFDPDPDSSVRPFSVDVKRRVLKFIGASRSPSSLPDLVDLMEDETTLVELALDAAEAVREIGLPQTPSRRNRDDAPAPALTPRSMKGILDRLEGQPFSPEDQKRLLKLQSWLQSRIKKGLTDDEVRVGPVDLRPGDWILMRNPSPYNRFTTHRPGLFTHVGIVTVNKEEDGVQRYVVVDLPERGDRIPATNVEQFLSRTLHYIVLRHPDLTVAKKMGEMARQLIGNESRFDLAFQTQRVEALRGKFSPGMPVHTYCAGLLLLIAQETGEPVADFFPVREGPAEGNCSVNLAKMGLAIGDDFVSPTGALFSSRLQLVGQCEPMYEPEREIREAIFDAFAQAMVERTLEATPNLFQMLRERVAGFSRSQPWLARALAKANNVHERTDLESAARAAAVVETLDSIVQTASDEFVQARRAITLSPEDRPRETQAARQFDRLRQTHAAFVKEFQENKITPRRLRVELVAYYVHSGIQALDQNFFGKTAKSP